MIEQIKSWAGVVALVAILLTWVVPAPDMLGASGTRFPNGLSADTTSPIAGQVRGTTLTITGAATLSSTLTVTATTTITSDYWSIGGIDYASVQQSFTAATTTPCSILNPFNATSTVLNYAAQITVATGTAAVIDVATSTTPYGTSSPAFVKQYSIASGVQDTLFWTPGNATTSTGFNRADSASPYYLAPTEYLNFKTGAGLDGYTWTGTCSATFMKP